MIDTLETGGTEISLYENVIRFENIHPVICHIYNGKTLQPVFTNNGIEVHSLGIDKKYAFLRAFRSLKETHKRNTTFSDRGLFNQIRNYIKDSRESLRRPCCRNICKRSLFKYLQSGGFVKSKDRCQIL